MNRGNSSWASTWDKLKDMAMLLAVADKGRGASGCGRQLRKALAADKDAGHRNRGEQYKVLRGSNNLPMAGYNIPQWSDKKVTSAFGRGHNAYEDKLL